MLLNIEVLDMLNVSRENMKKIRYWNFVTWLDRRYENNDLEGMVNAHNSKGFYNLTINLYDTKNYQEQRVIEFKSDFFQKIAEGFPNYDTELRHFNGVPVKLKISWEVGENAR